MRTDWWFFSGNGTGLTCLGPGLTATAVTGGGQGISTQHTHSLSLQRNQPTTSLPTGVPGWLPGRRRTTPLAPLGGRPLRPRFSASSRVQKQGIEGGQTNQRPPPPPLTLPLYPGTEARTQGVSTQYHCPSQNTLGADAAARGCGFLLPTQIARQQPDQPTWAGGPVLLNPVRLSPAYPGAHWVSPIPGTSTLSRDTSAVYNPHCID